MDELREKIAEVIRENHGAFSWEIAEAALRAIEEAGFAVVPKEPTAAMIEAGRTADPLSCDVDESDIAMVYSRIYSGMVSAACAPLNLEEPRG